MKVLVSGSTGFIGSALVQFLGEAGHNVTRLVRSQSQSRSSQGQVAEILWDPQQSAMDLMSIEGFDAVIHLAGDNIAEGRWTREKKARIRDSRVKGTRLLSESLARLTRPPGVLVCASAIGYYGDRGDVLLTEESAPGSGFLPQVCQEWEAATAPPVRKGVRVVNTRFGIILSPKGGALAKMLTPFRMGVGGPIGSGKQYMSWISFDDTIGAIHHVLITDSIHGPVNVVAPHPVTNLDFTKTLGRVISRPTVFPLPSFAARVAFGEMADALLLASARVKPVRLLDTAYGFRHSTLEEALRHLLGRAGG